MWRFMLYFTLISSIVACPYLRTLSPEDKATGIIALCLLLVVVIIIVVENQNFHQNGRKLKSENGAEGVERQLYQAINGPYCQATAGGTVTPSTANTCTAYAMLKPAFDAYVATLNAGSTRVYDLSNFYGTIVRLAFHDAGEVDITQGDLLGPDGCLSSDLASKGLVELSSINNLILEPTYQKICQYISRADYWVMLAKLALEAADPTKSLDIPYQYGRVDQTSCSGGYGRLPSAALGTDEFQRVFVNQMGLTMDDAGKPIDNTIFAMNIILLSCVVGRSFSWSCASS